MFNLVKKSGYHGEKRRKLFKIVDYLTYVENCVFLAFFYVFHHVNLNFFKITKVRNIYTSYGASFLFQVFLKLLMLIFDLY